MADNSFPVRMAGKYLPALIKRDPRDYFIPQDGVWRSDLLPQGLTIDQAIKDGTW